jgi:hypothetical protein
MSGVTPAGVNARQRAANCGLQGVPHARLERERVDAVAGTELEVQVGAIKLDREIWKPGVLALAL